MPRMSNEEIKKGYLICNDPDLSCKDCPYNDNYVKCSETLRTDARELIVEQEQEIARLKDENKQLHTNAGILARGVRDLDHENYELTEHIERLEAQNAEEIKILLVEDGSVDVDDLAMFIDEHDLKIKIVLYRQGSVPPRFLKQLEE